MNKIIEQLADSFSKLPGIGPRQANRFVFYLIKQPKIEIDKIIELLKNLKKEIHLCPNCFFIIEDSIAKLCEICQDLKRHKNLICVVEKETDVLNFEKTGRFEGTYFVLGGLIFSGNHRQDNKGIRIKELLERINNQIKEGKEPNDIEVILALNATTEGDATSLYIERTLIPLRVKTTRLARGLPRGGDIEYADEDTLTDALSGRR